MSRVSSGRPGVGTGAPPPPPGAESLFTPPPQAVIPVNAFSLSIAVFTKRVLRDFAINLLAVIAGVMLFKFYKMGLPLLRCSAEITTSCLTPLKMQAITTNMMWAEVGTLVLLPFSTVLYLLGRVRTEFLHHALVFKLAAAAIAGAMALGLMIFLMSYRNVLLREELQFMAATDPRSYLAVYNRWPHQVKMFFLHL